jgi:thymidylate synthase (FAD)
MEEVRPKVFHIASTQIDNDGLYNYLEGVSASSWTTDAPSDGEKLVEFAGRVCYRSFSPGLNKNVTKTRTGNASYISNILKSKHGSVIEHASDTYAIHNVSRICTHEIVRHRHASYSQESMRFVRLDDLRIYFPAVFEDLPNSDDIRVKFYEKCVQTEQFLSEMVSFVGLDGPGLSFEIKKKLTSAIRRLAPDGMATSLVMTSNHRNWRHLIEARTSRHAEEEIRIVFDEIFQDLVKRYPNLYADARRELILGVGEITFENSKI